MGAGVRRLFRFWLFCAVAAGLCSAALAAEPRRMLVVYDTIPNPPLYLGSGTVIDANKPGISVELLREAARRAGIEMEFKRVPWNRALYLVEIDEADGIFDISFKEERRKIGVYPMKDGKPDEDRAIARQNYVFYKRQDSPFSWDGRSVAHLDGAIGTVMSYSINDDLKEMNLPVEEAKTQELNLAKLAQGRIAAVADLEAMSDMVLNGNPGWFPDIVKLSPPLRNKAYYLMLSRKFVRENPDLAERLWAAIPAVIASPEYQVALRRYGQ